MKKVLLSSVAVIALGGIATAMAGSSAYQEFKSVQHGGFYVGAAAGYASVNLPEVNLNNSAVSFSAKSDFGYFTANAKAGYLYSVNQQFLLGVEGAYNYLPQIKYTLTYADNSSDVVKLSSYSIDFLGVAKYYLNDKFNAFVKAGGTYLHSTGNLAEVDANNTATTDSESEAHIKPKVTIGAGFIVMPQLELTAEYSHTFGTNYKNLSDITSAADKVKVPTSNSSNNVFLVGVNYYFF